MSMRQPISFVATFLLAVAMLSSSTANADALQGTYKSPLGRLQLEEKGGVVKARYAGGKSPCKFKRGKVVLEGTRLDDTVTGTLIACKVGKGCRGPVEGMAMLLVTRNGNVLSGAVHLDGGQCKTGISADSITLRKRVKKKSPPKPKPRKKPKKSPKPDAVDDGSNPGDTAAGSTNNASTRKDATDANAETAGEGVESGADSGAGDAVVASAGVNATDAPPEAPADAAGARRAAQDKAREAARFLGLGQAENARDLFREAVKIDPTYSEGYIGLGITYYQRDRYDEALEQYKLGLEANPANPDAYYNIGCIYALKGDKEQAFNYLQIALLNGYVDTHTIAQDPDLKSLADDPRFEQLKAGTLF